MSSAEDGLFSVSSFFSPFTRVLRQGEHGRHLSRRPSILWLSTFILPNSKNLSSQRLMFARGKSRGRQDNRPSPSTGLPLSSHVPTSPSTPPLQTQARISSDRSSSPGDDPFPASRPRPLFLSFPRGSCECWWWWWRACDRRHFLVLVMTCRPIASTLWRVGYGRLRGLVARMLCGGGEAVVVSGLGAVLLATWLDARYQHDTLILLLVQCIWPPSGRL